MAVQILQLGLSGSETTLPTESRTNNQGASTYNKRSARSANQTLHTDFLPKKGNWSITWGVISETDRDAVIAIIDLQESTPSFLSFKYTDEAGAFTTKTVEAEISSQGALIQRDEYFDSGLSISLVEV
jgi:hypothetical protein